MQIRECALCPGMVRLANRCPAMAPVQNSQTKIKQKTVDSGPCPARVSKQQSQAKIKQKTCDSGPCPARDSKQQSQTEIKSNMDDCERSFGMFPKADSVTNVKPLPSRSQLGFK